MNLAAKVADIQSRLSAPKTRKNSFAGYNYRSCEDILEAVKPLLKEHSLLLTITDEIVHFPSAHPSQVVTITDSKGKSASEVIDGDRFYVRATATITDGEQSYTVCGLAREAGNKKGSDDSQITGSASSYARKYALNGLFAIDDGKDADATQGQPAPARKATPKPAPEPSPLGEQDVVLRADADFSGDDQWQKASRSLHARAGDVVGRDDAHDVLHIMAELAGFSSLKAVPTKRLLTMREFIGGPKWTTYYTTEIEPALADLRLATTETE